MEQLPLFITNTPTRDPLIELMTPRDIYNRITELEFLHFKEDRRLEYKRSDIKLDDLAKYYSMFSNTPPEGGIVVIGVNDKCEISGCKNLSPKQINQIEKLHIDRCPLAIPEFKRIPCNVQGTQDFIICIYISYANRLVETNKGEAFIRYGDSIHKMTEPEKRDYRSTRKEIHFELEDCSLKWPESFDQDIIRNLCDRFRNNENIEGRTNEEILEIRNLGRISTNGFIPNNAVALLAAKNPRSFFPGCRVRIQRFEGTSEGSGKTYNPIIDRFIEGNVVTLIERASSVIDTIVYDFTWLNDDGKFITAKEYPRAAWFEALVNAVVHRSYIYGSDVTVKLFEDRMIVESPGGFCPPVNEKNIYEVRAARNPFLMDALYLLDYVKMAREGTRRMRESMKSLGLPEPIFFQESIQGLLVRVELRNNVEFRKKAGATDIVHSVGGHLWKQLDENEKKIVELAIRNGSVNVSDVQRTAQGTWHTSKKRLIRLVQKEILVHVHNSTDRDVKAHYIINPDITKNNS